MNRFSANIEHLLGKVPPQALELEEIVLGALMIDRNVISSVVSILKPKDFYKPAHQEIYQTIFDLYAESNPVDILTVSQLLRKKVKLDMVGGASYITKLTDIVNSGANVEYHARIIAELSIKRTLIEITAEIQKEAFQESSDALELLDQIQHKTHEATKHLFNKEALIIGDIDQELMGGLEAHRHSQSPFSGVPCGLHDIDKVTSGWQKPDLIILAARPAMGKTGFMCSIARNTAVDAGIPVAMFSLEMSAAQLLTRLYCAEAGVNIKRIRKNQLIDEEWELFKEKKETIARAPIYIDDTAAISMNELRAKAFRLKETANIGLVIIDYLQLMTASMSKNSQGNREQEIASISRGLKQLAKDLNVPVIALSQLSRAVEIRGGEKRPQLSDLRESGAIEADADVVLFLYRAEYYGIAEDRMGSSTKGIGEVIIAKHRNGELADIHLRFVADLAKFENLPNHLELPPLLNQDQGSTINTIQPDTHILTGNSNTNQSELPF
ncbi:replicative DNA helicase [Microscilla marina]|uniref:Replicative DNA helicase n=1 Tax=Microscilla marina ATCC 23134 TaxID=313606 RepID=A1ZU78_MICM2|nr:replicative DNA helicase [Microscilla marina]EAY26049.1 replicative DNA helicase [Microscilla marina ATCC 23134]